MCLPNSKAYGLMDPLQIFSISTGWAFLTHISEMLQNFLSAITKPWIENSIPDFLQWVTVKLLVH